MNTQQVVSRADLYKDENDDSIPKSFVDENQSQEEFPHEEFEFVDVVDNINDGKTEDIQGGEEQEQEQEQEDVFEFFPLFANEELTKVTIEENKKISDVMEADMEDEEEEGEKYPFEYVKQDRPESYYFGRYTEEEKKQFQDAAIDLTTLQNNSYSRTLYGKKDHTVLDLNRHNSQIEAEMLRSKKLKRRRPGKKQRLAHKMGKQHEQERADLKQNLKKRFRKRGGKKNKKPKLNPLANAGADIKD